MFPVKQLVWGPSRAFLKCWPLLLCSCSPSIIPFSLYRYRARTSLIFQSLNSVLFLYLWYLTNEFCIFFFFSTIRSPVSLTSVSYKLVTYIFYSYCHFPFSDIVQISFIPFLIIWSVVFLPLISCKWVLYLFFYSMYYFFFIWYDTN